MRNLQNIGGIHFFGIIWSFNSKPQVHFLPADIQDKSHIDDKTPKIHRPNWRYNQEELMGSWSCYNEIKDNRVARLGAVHVIPMF